MREKFADSLKDKSLVCTHRNPAFDVRVEIKVEFGSDIFRQGRVEANWPPDVMRS
jgi:hypothetical protein